MTSKCREALVLLNAIADAINCSGATVKLSGQAIGNAFYGLQGMDSSHVEVMRVVKALTVRIESESSYSAAAHAKLVPQNDSFSYTYNFSDSGARSDARPSGNRVALVSTIMNGQNIGIHPSTFTHSSKVLSAPTLTLLISSGNALWGLRNMTSDPPEVRAALQALGGKIRESKLEMNGQNIGEIGVCLTTPSPTRRLTRPR